MGAVLARYPLTTNRNGCIAAISMVKELGEARSTLVTESKTSTSVTQLATLGAKCLMQPGHI